MNVEENYPIKNILSKYKLNTPLPDDVRLYIKSKKRDMYIDILKKAGLYVFYSGIMFWMYLLLKKTGAIVFSMKMIALVTVAASLSAGLYFSNNILNVDEEVTQVEYVKIAPPVINRIKPQKIEVLQTLSTIMIKPFSGDSLTNGKLKTIHEKIIAEMKNLKGENFISPYNASSASNVKFHINGIVEVIDDMTIIIDQFTVLFFKTCHILGKCA